MRVLTFYDLKAKGIKYSREHLRRRERDGSFPLHIDLGEGRIGWVEEEIDAWISSRVARRDRDRDAAASKTERADV